MRIAVFTSNQARHLHLVEALREVADEIVLVQECTTIFPGEVADFFAKSPVMQRYFEQVIRAEQRIFGRPRLLNFPGQHISLRMGDLSLLDPDALRPALDCDLHIVFGASYIRGALAERLIERKAVNIHMGVSPYYRGSSCNFWALYDGRADLVGSTIHRLSSGLDSGKMLFQALPPRRPTELFDLGMEAVRAAHLALVAAVADGSLLSLEPVRQDKSLQLRYTRNADFTDAVAEEFLARGHGPDWVAERLAEGDDSLFVRPYFAQLA